MSAEEDNTFVDNQSSKSYEIFRKISHQNHVATVRIQRVFRGHITRVELWKYGGILMVSRVKKIQRCWRGMLVCSINLLLLCVYIH